MENTFLYLLGRVLCSDVVQMWNVSALRTLCRSIYSDYVETFVLSELKMSIMKYCEFLPLVSGARWSFVFLCKVKSSVINCSIGTFLRNTSAGTQVSRNLIRELSKIKG